MNARCMFASGLRNSVSHAGCSSQRTVPLTGRRLSESTDAPLHKGTRTSKTTAGAGTAGRDAERGLTPEHHDGATRALLSEAAVNVTMDSANVPMTATGNGEGISTTVPTNETQVMPTRLLGTRSS